jgi:hypothetical protein
VKNVWVDYKFLNVQLELVKKGTEDSRYGWKNRIEMGLTESYSEALDYSQLYLCENFSKNCKLTSDLKEGSMCLHDQTD